MKKRWMMALALLVCLCLLTACKTSKPAKFQVNTNPPAGNQTAGNAGDVLVGDEYMDPLAEEDDYDNMDDSAWMEDLPTPEPPTPTPAPTVRGEYAGATPVPIDPIDKPTPTPVPPLAAFSYSPYEATKLGVSFQAPTGWKADTSDPAYYVLRNPSSVGGYQAEIVIHSEKVSRQYTESDLKTAVKSMLSAIEALDVVVEFSPSNTDTRNLLDATGVYANYTATLSNGAEIAGRVHATCVDKVLYTVHVSSPKAYWDMEGDADYKDGVYDKLRKTIQITK
ncbi:MAG: hypothetical protein IJE07_13140 [Clostridia bacterium]|nr:hypothetical protein [Clostridia bacterium]